MFVVFFFSFIAFVWVVFVYTNYSTKLLVSIQSSSIQHISNNKCMNPSNQRTNQNHKCCELQCLNKCKQIEFARINQASNPHTHTPHLPTPIYFLTQNTYIRCRHMDGILPAKKGEKRRENSTFQTPHTHSRNLLGCGKVWFDWCLHVTIECNFKFCRTS